jgi:hypothetical protein
VRVADVQNAQLPVDRMLPQTVMDVSNKEECVFCQYFLHYVQQAITDPKTEVLHSLVWFPLVVERQSNSVIVLL